MPSVEGVKSYSMYLYRLSPKLAQSIDYVSHILSCYLITVLFESGYKRSDKSMHAVSNLLTLLPIKHHSMLLQFATANSST